MSAVLSPSLGAQWPQLSIFPTAEPSGYQPTASVSVGESRRRARRTDPATSHAAAADAVRFAGSQSARILRALQALGSATAHELALHTGLTVVQCDRRLPELERAGSARVLMVGAKPMTRAGFRVWARA